MCRVLGVNRTSFHDWERRPPSDRALADAWLSEKIKQIHRDSRGVYGAPRIHAELRLEHGIRVGRKRVARLMKAAGIAGIRPRKRWRTTIRVPGVEPATDLVERDFRRDGPNVLWVADITYLRSGEGWLYLAAVQDTYSRAIVGWSMATHMRSALVVDALRMALARRRPGPGLTHHSDQGSQYVSLAFGRAARQAGIAISMGSRGDAYDNAVAETFFATLKKELVNRRTWPSRLELQSAVFEYIEAFYNRQRRHSTLGMVSPAEYEQTQTTIQIKENQTTNYLTTPCHPNRGRSIRTKHERCPIAASDGKRERDPIACSPLAVRHVSVTSGSLLTRPTGSRYLRAGVFLRRARLELEADEGLLAYHPSVMARLDHVSVARPDVGLGSVLVRDVEPAGLSDTHVPDLAAVCAHDRLDALRPLPARLERHAGGGGAPNADHVDACLVGRPRLIR